MISAPQTRPCEQQQSRRAKQRCARERTIADGFGVAALRLPLPCAQHSVRLGRPRLRRRIHGHVCRAGARAAGQSPGRSRRRRRSGSAARCAPLLRNRFCSRGSRSPLGLLDRGVQRRLPRAPLSPQPGRIPAHRARVQRDGAAHADHADLHQLLGHLLDRGAVDHADVARAAAVVGLGRPIAEGGAAALVLQQPDDGALPALALLARRLVSLQRLPAQLRELLAVVRPARLALGVRPRADPERRRDGDQRLLALVLHAVARWHQRALLAQAIAVLLKFLRVGLAAQERAVEQRGRRRRRWATRHRARRARFRRRHPAAAPTAWQQRSAGLS